MTLDILDLGFSIKIDETKALALLRGIFPSVSFSLMSESFDSNSEANDAFLISVTQHEHPDCDFPSQLTIWGLPAFPLKRYREFLTSLAHAVALKLSCRVIVGGCGYGEDETPYWSLIFEQGKVYLANDSGSIYADGKGGHVQIVRELKVDVKPLEEMAQLFDG